jgi:hypothetical protein
MADNKVHMQTVPASKRGKLWLYVFLVAVFLLLINLSTLVWPRVRVVVKPEFELVKIDLPIKIDLDLKESNFNTGVIPGQFITSFNQEAELTNPGFRFYKLSNNKKVIVEADLINKLIDNSLRQNVGENRIIRQGTLDIRWQDPIENRSGRSFIVTANIQAQFYPLFPFVEWQNHLAGKSIIDIEKWVKLQPGVAGVLVELYPIFFAKISQKVPSNPSAITIILDIN